MSSPFHYPPSDPDVAWIVDTLTVNAEKIAGMSPPFESALPQAQSLAALRGLSSEALETLYAVAYALCDEKQFHAALPVSLHLALYERRDWRFHFMSAACLQGLGAYKEAATMYTQVLQLDQANGAAAYRLGECHSALSEPEQAIKAFELTIELARGNFDLRALQDKAGHQIHTLMYQPQKGSHHG